MMRHLLFLAFVVTVMFLAACVMVLVYYVSDAECRSRGGHTEVVWGGRGGWTCDGGRP